MTWLRFQRGTHIAERMLGIYIPQFLGGHVHLIGDPALLLGALVYWTRRA